MALRNQGFRRIIEWDDLVRSVCTNPTRKAKGLAVSLAYASGWCRPLAEEGRFQTMKILGNLMFNGRVRARAVTALIRSQGKRWSGEIQLPKDAQINKGCFDLVLNDGRRGKVQI